MAPVEGPDTPAPCEVLWIERLGSHHILDLRLGTQTLRARTRPDHPVQNPGRAWIGFRVAPHHVLDGASERFLAV